MALRWQWEECIGELEIKEQVKARIRVYQGNAFAIFLNEWEGKDGEQLWSIFNFFADKEHFKNCAKDKEWNYAENWVKLTLWKLPRDFYPLIQDLQKRGVIIEIRSKENGK